MFINQFPPNIIRSIRQFERINKKYVDKKCQLCSINNIYIYISKSLPNDRERGREREDDRDVMDIDVGNGFVDPSSKPERDRLHFIQR